MAGSLALMTGQQSERSIWITIGSAVVAIGLIALVLNAMQRDASEPEPPAATASAESRPEVTAQPQLACEPVAPEALASIAQGLQDGYSFGRAGAVKSTDRGDAWFVSAEIVGPGVPAGEETLVVTVTPSILEGGSGTIIGVGGFASEFTDWPKGAETSFEISITEDAAEAADECVRAQF